MDKCSQYFLGIMALTLTGYFHQEQTFQAGLMQLGWSVDGAQLGLIACILVSHRAIRRLRRTHGPGPSDWFGGWRNVPIWPIFACLPLLCQIWSQSSSTELLGSEVAEHVVTSGWGCSPFQSPYFVAAVITVALVEAAYFRPSEPPLTAARATA